MTLDELLRSTNLHQPPPAARGSAYVHAGHMFVSADPHEISTILGSCEAVALWDPAMAFGGLNHYMLPVAAGTQEGPRYGSWAIPRLIAELVELGASKARLCAKVFGGACVLRAFHSSGGELGRRNIEIAQKLLLEARIPIVFEDVGGDHGRKLVFRTDDGTSSVRSL